MDITGKVRNGMAIVAHISRYIKNKEYNYETTYLTLGDLLTPVSGIRTRAQYVAVSRIIDIEACHDRRGDFLWQRRIYEHRFGKNYSKEEIRKLNLYFQSIIDSLDHYGHIEASSSMTTYRRPITPAGSTHRIAWFFLNDPNAFIPVKIEKRIISEEKLHGEKSLKDVGFSFKDIRDLDKKYDLLMEKLDVDVSGMIHGRYISEEVLKLIEDKGKCTVYKKVIVSKYNYSKEKYFSPHLQKCKKRYGGMEMTLVRIRLDKQYLYFSEGRVKSKYITKLSREITKLLHTRNWGYIASTVAESKELECLFQL